RAPRNIACKRYCFEVISRRADRLVERVRRLPDPAGGVSCGGQRRGSAAAGSAVGGVAGPRRAQGAAGGGIGDTQAGAAVEAVCGVAGVAPVPRGRGGTADRLVPRRRARGGGPVLRG